MIKLKNYFRKILPPWAILLSHKIRGILAALLYNFPARKLKVIGVTGTNGKTTTAHLITSILEEAGFKVGLATTIDFKIGERTWANETRLTTLSPFALQKLLKEMVRADCQYAIIETTSHAIAQYRNWGIFYEASCLTNLTHDHLDYHKDFFAYRQIKGKLFSNSETKVINLDDRSSSFFLSIPTKETLTYGLKARADIMARKIIAGPVGSLFTLITPSGQIVIDFPLPGLFNISNALAATGLAFSQGIGIDLIKRGLEKTKIIPGRMEKISGPQPFTIIVDYAHTPDALEKVYQTLKPACKGKLIALLGACGDRDKTKRPILGALAGRFADYVIVTNEDPYSEKPEKIIQEVAAGVPRGRTNKGEEKEKKREGIWWWKILDRRAAIKKALNLAKKDDIVILTGKGAESSIVWGKEKIPWSEKKVIKEELEKMGYS